MPRVPHALAVLIAATAMVLAYDLALFLRLIDAPTITEEFRALAREYPRAFALGYFSITTSLYYHFRP